VWASSVIYTLCFDVARGCTLLQINVFDLIKCFFVLPVCQGFNLSPLLF
jgi:hypothetical protein